MMLNELMGFDTAKVRDELKQMTRLERTKLWLAARHLSEIITEVQLEEGDLDDES